MWICLVLSALALLCGLAGAVTSLLAVRKIRRTFTSEPLRERRLTMLYVALAAFILWPFFAWLMATKLEEP